MGLGGLGHMAVKLARAFGARVVVFTTSPGKADDAVRLGAHEVVISTHAAEMQKHAGSFDFILDTVSAVHDLNPYLDLLKRDGTLTMVGAPETPLPARRVQPPLRAAAASPARSSAASARPRRCSTSAPSTASPPTSS